jgi:hypothetical protein
VAEENLMIEGHSRLQRRDPPKFTRSQLSAREFVSRIRLPRPSEKNLPLAVAREMNPVLRQEKLRRFKRQERTRHAVPQVDDGIETPTCEVPDNCLKCGQVSMNVCQDGDAHGKMVRHLLSLCQIPGAH